MVMHIKTPKIVSTLMESKMALYVLVAPLCDECFRIHDE